MNAYDKSGAVIADNYGRSLMDYTYTYDGGAPDTRKHGYNVAQGIVYAAHDRSSGGTQGYWARQGAAVSNGVLFQGISGTNLGDMLALYNHATGAFIATVSCPVGHGSTMSFSDEYYASGDEFPLLYAWSGGAINAIRMTRSSGTAVRRLLRDGTDKNTDQFVVDPANRRIITSVTKISGDWAGAQAGDRQIITVYDMDDLTPTENADEYTMAKIDQYELPVIQANQGMCFLNGLVYILSSADTVYRTQYGLHTAWLYVLDPYARRYQAIFKAFPQDVAEAENEAVVPRYNSATGLYDLELITVHQSARSALVQLR